MVVGGGGGCSAVWGGKGKPAVTRRPSLPPSSPPQPTDPVTALLLTTATIINGIPGPAEYAACRPPPPRGGGGGAAAALAPPKKGTELAWAAKRSDKGEIEMEREGACGWVLWRARRRERQFLFSHHFPLFSSSRRAVLWRPHRHPVRLHRHLRRRVPAGQAQPDAVEREGGLQRLLGE